MNNTCVCCGDLIPEGRQVCPKCECKRSIYDGVKRKTVNSLCWKCSNMKCSWISDLIPVPGWKATPTKIKQRGKFTYSIDSYHVEECPEFKGGSK